MDQTADMGVETAEAATEEKVESVVSENKTEELETKGDEYTKQEVRELGRLKRTLDTKCPDCSKPLQLRARAEKQMVRGEEISSEIDYVCCSANCGYEDEIENKKRKLVYDKTAMKKEDLPVRGDRNRRDGNDRYPKRSTTATRTRENNRKSFRNSK